MAVNKRKILESAQKYLQKGALDKALKEYATLLKADPRDANIRLKVGDIHLKQGKTDEAVNAYLRVAESFMKDGFDAKAVALFKQITKIDSKRADVYIPLAELYQRMGLTSDAMKALQTAADSAYRSGAKDQALDLLRKMAALDPANTTNRIKVADLLRQEGRSEEALAEYNAVVAELERQGAHEERVRILERILEVDPAQVAALAAVGRARLSNGDAAGAEALGRRLVERHAEESDGYEILAEACIAAGRRDEGAEVYRRLADLYRQRGDDEKARDIMQRFGGAPALSVDETDQPVLETDDDLAFDAEVPAGELSLESPEFSDPGFVLDQGLRLGAPIKGLEAGAEETPEAGAGESSGSLPPLPDFDRGGRAPAAAKAAEAPEGDPEQLVAEAGVYLRYGKNERALDSLRAVLAHHPDHAAALEKLGEALIACGDEAGAVEPLRRAGELAREAGDDAALARVRERLGTIDPAAAEALASRPVPSEAPAEADGDADGLDEFDLDIEGPEETAPAPEPTPDANAELDIDLDLDAAGDEPEPSPPEQEESVDAAPSDVDLDIEFDLDMDDAGTEAGEAAAQESPSEESSGSTTTPAQIVEDLEEADFFFQQGMLAEARGVYERIISVAPNHPQALLRLGEIEAREAEAQDAASEGDAAEAPEEQIVSDTGFELDVEDDLDVEAPEEQTPAAPEAKPTRSPAPASPPAPQAEITAPSLADLDVDHGETDDEEESTLPSEAAGVFDLAAELSDAFTDGDGSGPAPDHAGSTEGEAFEQVFAAFKAGVQDALGEGDYQAHYDLGIAYKEMGLFEDAIGEFQQAMGVPEHRLVCLHMMGLCALDLGRLADARAHLEQALALPAVPEEQQVALRFDLGRAHAAAGDVARAREAFEAVRAVDPDFCDVAEHIAALDSPDGPPTASDEEEEAFESFDDLLVESETEPPVDAAPEEAAYESFDDLLEDAEEAEEVEEATEADEVEEPPTEPEAPVPPAAKGRPRRKKISFV